MSAINWFEIPATDLKRAVKFYSTVLGAPMEIIEGMGLPMAFLPSDPTGVGGSLIQGEGYVPSMDGSLVYLNGMADLNPMLGRVEGAGGSVIMPKTSIGDNGFIALFIDSEGNKVGLHSIG